MKRIDRIEVEIFEDNAPTRTEMFAGRATSLEEFFQFLIDEGFYDDIQTTKSFSTSKTVMKRLKGGR